MVLDAYDIPDEIFEGEYSDAFVKFLRNWFGDSRSLSFGVVDRAFSDDLTPEELKLARELLRRNSGLKYTHIIECRAELRDLDSAPALRAMFACETDPSRQLTVAGTLWRLARDPVLWIVYSRRWRRRCDLEAGALTTDSLAGRRT